MPAGNECVRLTIQPNRKYITIGVYVKGDEMGKEGFAITRVGGSPRLLRVATAAGYEAKEDTDDPDTNEEEPG